MDATIAVTETEPLIEVRQALSLSDAVRSALGDAINLQGKLSEFVLDIDGMSGRKFRYFLNNLLGRIYNPRYLEVGSWAGSTFCSAIYGNALRAVAVDNWSLFGGPVSHFFSNLSQCCSVHTRTSVVFEDFRKVNFGSLGSFNVYLFDGPHEYQDQYDGLAMAIEALTDEFVFIVDDWNWDAVRSGTFDVIRDLGLDIVLNIEIRTTMDGSTPKLIEKRSDWHNGYLVAVLRKPGTAGRR